MHGKAALIIGVALGVILGNVTAPLVGSAVSWTIGKLKGGK